MCGLCGFLDLQAGTDESTNHATLSRMTARLRHRGPDDSGIWQDPVTGIGLGHTRLSILDLSPEGHSGYDFSSIVIDSPSGRSLLENVIPLALTHTIADTSNQTCDKDPMVADSTIQDGP
jgi:hypothetical protein